MQLIWSTDLHGARAQIRSADERTAFAADLRVPSP